jgi:Pyruvate/2-oxoglutarate dehydrogenase complex, dihydrolipoamide dehydrogenase (E3) component, and related enzymes
MSITQNTPSGQNDKVEEYDLVIPWQWHGWNSRRVDFCQQRTTRRVIERKYVGGSCPNIACLPSKNVIHSAKVASYFRRSEEFGIPKRNFAVDMRAVRERKRRMVSHWNNVYLDNYKKSGAEFILGLGSFRQS